MPSAEEFLNQGAPSAEAFLNDNLANPPKSDSFLSEMGDNFSNAIQSGKDLLSGNYADFGRNQPSPKTEELAGKLFPDGSSGSLMDAVHNLGDTSPSDWSGSLLEKLGQTPEGKALSVMGGLNPLYNAAGTAINRYVNPAIQSATGIAPENLQLGELALPIVGLKKAGSINDPAISAAKYGAAKVLENVATPKANLSEINLKDISSNLYTQARAIPDALPSDISNSFASKVNNAYTAPMVNGQLTEGANYLNNILDRYKGFEDKKLNIANIDDLDKNLTGDIQRAYKGGYNLEGGKLKDIQSNLRENFRQAPGGENLKNAIDLWSSGSKAEQLNTIIENAKLTKNPATAMQTGFRTLYKNLKDNPQGWSEDEISAIQKASKSGIGADVLSILGQRVLGPMVGAGAGFAAGGPLGAVVGAGIDLAGRGISRKGATTLQEARGMKAFNKIAERPAVASVLKQEAKPTLTNKIAQSLLDRIKSGGDVNPADIGKLPPRDAQSLLNEIRLLPPPDKEALGSPSAEVLGDKQNILDANNPPIITPDYAGMSLKEKYDATKAQLLTENPLLAERAGRSDASLDAIVKQRMFQNSQAEAMQARRNSMGAIPATKVNPYNKLSK